MNAYTKMDVVYTECRAQESDAKETPFCKRALCLRLRKILVSLTFKPRSLLVNVRKHSLFA